MSNQEEPQTRSVDGYRPCPGCGQNTVFHPIIPMCYPCAEKAVLLAAATLKGDKKTHANHP